MATALAFIARWWRVLVIAALAWYVWDLRTDLAAAKARATLAESRAELAKTVADLDTTVSRLEIPYATTISTLPSAAAVLPRLERLCNVKAPQLPAAQPTAVDEPAAARDADDRSTAGTVPGLSRDLLATKVNQQRLALCLGTLDAIYEANPQ